MMKGPNIASLGGTYNFRGRTAGMNGLRVTGHLILHGRWDDRAWRVLGQGDTNSLGEYTLTIPLSQRGALQVRLATADGYVLTKTLEVR